jgi:hypothetical protein
MRKIKAVLAVTVLASSSACRSDAGEREALIEASLDRCIRDFARDAAERPGSVPEGMDGERICTCAVARLSQGKSLGEVRAMSGKQPPSPEQIETIGRCVVDEARRAGVMANRL